MILIPEGEKVRLIDLAPGTLFSCGDDCIAVKSEYCLDNGKIEAIIVGSGEFFHGAKTVEEQYNLMVQPLKCIDEKTELFMINLPSDRDKQELAEMLRNGHGQILPIVQGDIEFVREFDYRSGYDFIMALQEELAAQHHDAEIGCLDYKVVKALAATYELQDYLANRIAKAVADGELDPDLED